MVFWGWPERSTYHTTCVNRVSSYLRKFCIESGKEKKFVQGRITDAWGYDLKTKTVYFCEIKVNSKDLMKAVFQIHDTVHKYVPKDPENQIIPVIAIPKKLYDELTKYDPGQLSSLLSLCNKNEIAVWKIEQSTVVQLQGPRPQKLVKKVLAAPKKPASKTKAAARPKATTKPKVKKAATAATAKSQSKAKSTTTKAKATAKPAIKKTTTVKSTISKTSGVKAKPTTRAKTASKAPAAKKKTAVKTKSK